MNSINVEHLKLIQGVINRMAQTSSILKGWTITVIVAIFGLTVASTNSLFALLALFPAILFWFLDGYYLWLERLFRELYEHVRTDTQKTQVPPYSMNIELYKKKISYRKILFRPALCGFYISMIVASFILYTLLF